MVNHVCCGRRYSIGQDVPMLATSQRGTTVCPWVLICPWVTMTRRHHETRQARQGHSTSLPGDRVLCKGPITCIVRPAALTASTRDL